MLGIGKGGGMAAAAQRGPGGQPMGQQQQQPAGISGNR